MLSKTRGRSFCPACSATDAGRDYRCGRRCAHPFGKLTYVIKEDFSDGKEPESLDGKSFVITGKLNYFDNRDAMAEFIEKNGGHVAVSVSKKTAFLVCNDGDSTSSEAQKAAELGIPVITEGEFLGRFGFPGEYDEKE